jgi:GTP diphosphokinase / guanosine-3',5'-bis(diphosphate) 3'-diphosphatase
MLRQEMLRYGIPFYLLEGEKAGALYQEFGVTGLEGLHISIGEGRARLKEILANVVNILAGGVSPLATPTGAFNNIELTTLDPVSVKLSSCCKPNPTTKGNCALLTTKGVSVHDKRCERFKKLKFQREDAVNVFWRARKTNVRKPQTLHVLKASRKEMMHAISFAPEAMQMQGLEVLTSYSSANPAWELIFKVPNLYILQKILRHFDKTHIPYEFDLDC